jgi:hypothetical protein
MLQTSYEMMTNLEQYIDEFNKLNTGINENFRTNYLTKINEGYNYLGLDNQLETKENKQNIANLTETFGARLSLFSIALKYAFRDQTDRGETISQSLELNRFKRPYSKGSLMELALNFSQSLAGYSVELKEKDISEQMLTDISEISTDYIEAFKNQNSGKSSQSSVNEEQQVVLNCIYGDIIAISEMAQTIFRRDRNKAKLLTYSAIVKKYSQTRKRKSTSAPVTAIEPEAVTINNLDLPENYIK